MAVLLNFVILVLLVYVTIDGIPVIAAKGTYRLLPGDLWEGISNALASLGEWLNELVETLCDAIASRLPWFLQNLVRFIVRIGVFLLLNTSFVLLCQLFFGVIYTELSKEVSSLASGNGLSILGIFRAIFVVVFQVNGLWGGLWRLFLFVLFNILYFLIVYGFLMVEHSHDERESRITYIAKNHLEVPIIFVIGVFVFSLFFQADRGSGVFTILSHFATRFNLSSVLLPAITQTVAVVLPAKTATVVIRLVNGYEGLTKSNVFTSKNRRGK